MCKFRLFILLAFSLYRVLVFSQTPDDNDIIVKSISYLNEKLYLNIQKTEKYILISYEERFFIYNIYSCVNDTSQTNIYKVNVYYDIKKIDKEKYYFRLSYAGVIQGTFYYKKGKFKKLNYTKQSAPLEKY